MIVKSIKQNKDNYSVIIDDKDIKLSEDVIVKFSLYAGKEIDEKVFYELTLAENYNKIYNQALRYSIKYNKPKRAVYEYLHNKNHPSHLCESIVNELEAKKVIDDYKIAEGLTLTYYKKGNGRHLIKARLEALLIADLAIDAAISKIDMDEYLESMNRYALKYYESNYNYDNYIRIMKTKEYLKKHGYTYDEISRLKLNEL